MYVMLLPSLQRDFFISRQIYSCRTLVMIMRNHASFRFYGIPLTNRVTDAISTAECTNYGTMHFGWLLHVTSNM